MGRIESVSPVRISSGLKNGRNANCRKDIMNVSTTSHIQAQSGVCGGKPCVAGTRIRVQDIYVWHELHGLSADEIVSRFPQVTLADVYAALSYYWDHRDEIQRQMQEESAFVDAIKLSSPSPLAPKRSGSDAANDPLSS